MYVSITPSTLQKKKKRCSHHVALEPDEVHFYLEGLVARRVVSLDEV